MSIVSQWRAALADLVVRYPEREVHVDVQDDGVLRIYFDSQRCAVTGKELPGFCISNVSLDCFPGAYLARAWVAAAWAGYLAHEALELVTYHGQRVLDPHADPYPENPYNRGVREALPVRLNRETLTDALCWCAIAMTREQATALVAEWWGK